MIVTPRSKTYAGAVVQGGTWRLGATVTALTWREPKKAVEWRDRNNAYEMMPSLLQISAPPSEVQPLRTVFA
jgi:hypothetical protein